MARGRSPRGGSGHGALPHSPTDTIPCRKALPGAGRHVPGEALLWLQGERQRGGMAQRPGALHLQRGCWYRPSRAAAQGSGVFGSGAEALSSVGLSPGKQHMRIWIISLNVFSLALLRCFRCV